MPSTWAPPSSGARRIGDARCRNTRCIFCLAPLYPEYPQGLFPDSSPTYPQGLYSSAPGAHGEVGSAVGLYLESGFRIVHRATKDTYMDFHAVAPFLSYSLNSSD